MVEKEGLGADSEKKKRDGKRHKKIEGRVREREKEKRINFRRRVYILQKSTHCKRKRERKQKSV
jgi:hypothetical protein